MNTPIKYSALLFALCALTAPSVFAADMPEEGVYRQTVKVRKKGMMFEPGDKMISEVIIYGEKSSKAVMKIGTPAGVACSIEDGAVASISATEFTVSEAGMFFGDPACKVDFKIKDQTLKITGTQSCSDFCGYGAKFEGTKVKKACDTASEDMVAHHLDMFFISETNVKDCD